MRLKHIFLPTKQNHYHPHAIRWTGLSIVLLMIIGANTVYNWQTAHTMRVLGYATAISSYEIVNLTNQQRSSNGLAALNTDPQLTQAAQAKAADMFAKDYWAHVSPTGEQPWDFITAAGYDYETAGENLAKDFNTSAGVVNAWMNSPEHRANILNGTYKDVGVAVMNGTLQGSETTLVVAMYASRTTPPAPAPAATQTTTPTVASKPTPAPQASTSAEETVTPAATPVTSPSQPAPISTSEPTPTAQKPSAKPTVAARNQTASKTVQTLSNTRPVTAREQLNWAQQVTVFMLSVILLINVFKHTVVWRTQRRGWRHIWLRAHPAAQYGLLFVSILVMLASAHGVIQ